MSTTLTLIHRLKIHIFIVVLISCLSVTACDRPAEKSLTLTEDEKQTVLRFGHDMPETSAHHLAALRYAEFVLEKSHGKLRIEVYPAQELGNDHEMIAMAQAGSLDIILPPTAKLSTLLPEMQLFDLPFLFDSREEAYQVLDGPAGTNLLAKLRQHGLVGMAFWESGFKQMTANRVVESLDDFHNMRFRIMRSEVISDQFKVWGAETVVIDFSRTFNALKDKVIDGQENPLGSIYNMQFYKAQSHLILSHHGYLAQVLTFSEKSFNSLSAKYQNLLMQAVAPATGYQREQVINFEKRFLKEFRESNINISELPATVRDKLKIKSMLVLEKHRQRIGTEIIEQTLQTLGEMRKPGDDEIVIGLDADLAGNSSFSGLAIKRGMEIAITEINHKGGVLGKKLRLMSKDNSMISARGIENLREFSEIPNLVAVMGGISSPVALSQLKIIHEKKILYLDPWAAATDIVDNNYKPNYVFRVSVRDEYAAMFMLRKALKISDRVGLLLVNNGWGRSSYDAFTAEFNRLEASPVITEWFDWGESEYRKKIEKLRQAECGVVIYVGNPVEAASLLRTMYGMDYHIPVISHWGITGTNFPDMVGDILDKIDLRVLQTFSFIDNRSRLARNIVKTYRNRYGINTVQEIVSPTGTAHAYDLVHLLVMAIRKAGKVDRESIRREMERLGTYNGLVRNYSPPFSEARHEALGYKDYFLARYNDGVLVPIK